MKWEYVAKMCEDVYGIYVDWKKDSSSALSAMNRSMNVISMIFLFALCVNLNGRMLSNEYSCFKAG